MIIPQEILEALCCKDIRHPYNIVDEDTIQTDDCNCDNCFYGTNKLALAYISLLTALNSKQMRIVFKGIDPKTVEYEQTCPECNTIFAFLKVEVEHDQRDGSYINCPVCDKALTPKYDRAVSSAASDYYNK